MKSSHDPVSLSFDNHNLGPNLPTLSMEEDCKLNIIIFPWLAFGHLLPALDLSKSLASKGHHVSFISTPRNIQRLPPIHPTLSPLITLVSLPLPHIENLPDTAQASTDVPPSKAKLLIRAFDALKPHFAEFLSSSTTKHDWVMYDFAHHWLPEIARKHDIPCVFFGPYCASMLSFLGPSSVLLTPQGEEGSRFSDLTSFIAPPKWVPFPSDVVFRIHEVLYLSQRAALDKSEDLPGDVSEMYRFGVAIRECEFVALRSCRELEPEWLNLLAEIYGKPVIPLGSLHPLTKAYSEINRDDEEQWMVIKEWLDNQNEGTVIYVAFGTEATLSQDQVTQIATGLEKSGLSFFWVLRTPPESSGDILTMLPDGFLKRVEGRGVVWTSWVPQVKILGHDSVGGVLTQCGWNSVNEALGFGRVLLLLPMVYDQGLIARFFVGKKLGYEVPKDQGNGSFTSDSVAESVRLVMVDQEGEVLRSNAKQMGKLLTDKSVMGRYLDSFVEQLKAHKQK